LGGVGTAQRIPAKRHTNVLAGGRGNEIRHGVRAGDQGHAGRVTIETGQDHLGRAVGEFDGVREDQHVLGH
jgi:hypothetical protein